MNAASPKDQNRQGIVVVVPTTDEPILLRRLALLPKIPTSRVVLGNETSDPCEGWTRDYNNMMRPDAPARALLGLPEAGGFRLVVSADIDHGKSWMMPVLAAHAAASLDLPVSDRIAGSRALIWTTGAVNLSYAETLAGVRVVDDDYHLKSKAERSRTLFADAAHAGTPVICLLPDAPGAPEAATWLGAILKAQPHHIAIVAGPDGLMQALKAFAARGDLADLARPQPAAEPPGNGAAAAGTGLVPVAAANADAAAGPGPAMPEDVQAPPPAASAAPASHTPVQAAGAAQPAAALPAAQAAAPLAQRRPEPAAAPPPAARPRAPFPLGVGIVLGLAGLGTALSLAYMALTPAAQGQRQPVAAVQPQPIANPPIAGQPGSTPPAATPAVARLVQLRAGAGRNCGALILDAQPRFEEAELMLTARQAGLEIDRAVVCGLMVTGLNQVSARFAPLGRDVIVPSLSVGNRIIFNTASAAAAQVAIELSGAETGRITLGLR